VRFALAGTVGFVVDAGVLYLLMAWLDAGAMLGRGLSFLCASLVTWRINRRFTFRANGTGGWLVEWLRYLWASATGAAVNYAVYALLIVSVSYVGRVPTLGVAAGSIAGMLVNFLLYKHVVFRRQLDQSTH
jgi:putative flippase GtrA